MPTVPTSLPPPLNVSRSFLQALHALSPPSLFRVRQQQAQSQSPLTAQSDHKVHSPKPPMPEHVADTLLQLIDFLEEHHRRTEGLYQRDAPFGHETEEILRVLRGRGDEPLPDLVAFSPYSLTAAIKEILGDDYEPMIPYTMSQLLLERTAKQDDNATLHEILATVKRLAPTKRELLKVLLIHLHHISTSIPSHMNAKSLAKHIGVFVIRPTDENGADAKTVRKQRKRIARLMIEYANALPYNEGSEISQSSDTEIKTTTHVTTGGVDAPATESANELPICEPVYYVQVLWDPNMNIHTEVTLQELLSPFGDVISLALNESGTRAIAAFGTSDSALAAAEAEFPGLRIRCQKQRNQDSASVIGLTPSAEDDFFTSTPSPTKEMKLLPSQISLEEVPVKSALESMEIDNGEQTDRVAFFKTDAPSDTVAYEENDTLIGSPTFLHKLERPPSLLLVQKAMKTMQSSESMMLEDVESPRSSPDATNNDDQPNPLQGSLHKISEAADEVERSVVEATEKAVPTAVPEKRPESGESNKLQRRRSLKQLLSVETTIVKSSDSSAKREDNDVAKPKHRKSLFSPPTQTKIGLISDLKLMLSRKRTPRSRAEPRRASVVEPVIDAIVETHATTEKALATRELALTETRSIRTQTTATILALQDNATDTDDLPNDDANSVDEMNATTEISLKDLQAESMERLSICLHTVKTELTNLASALSASRQSEVDKAVLRAHERVIDTITLALDAEPIDSSGEGQHPYVKPNLTQEASATSEFVSFLEMRSSTQVKILEAEVRAGQELLRLHRCQHQKELVDLETEITSLRVIQNETEKMCVELRSDVRKTRAELTCHVAAAASMQRDRRDADEKLIICENKLRAREQELLQLQVAHDAMQVTAGSAQRRLEEHRARGLQPQPADNGSRRPQPHGDIQFPQMAAFLKLRQEAPTVKHTTMLPTVLQPGQYANTEALTTMKKKLHDQIRLQTEATTKSLRELHAFGTHSDPFGDDDLDLEQLEQQLGSAQADMHATMNESRHKLELLLDPVRSMDSDPFNPDDTTAEFYRTGLIERLLTNALSLETTNQDNSRSHISDSEDDVPFQTVEISMPSWKSLPPDTQSEMYRKWIQRRSQAPGNTGATPRQSRVTTATPTSHTNDSAMRQAQESMVRFQQTLASMQKPTS